MTSRTLLRQFAFWIAFSAMCFGVEHSYAAEVGVSHSGGAALFQHVDGETWVLLGPSKAAGVVSTKHDRNRVDFLNPDKNGFSKVSVKTWIDGAYVRAEFRRVGKAFRLVRLTSSSSDRLFAADFDEEVTSAESVPVQIAAAPVTAPAARDPRCSESVIVQTARTATVLGTLEKSCESKSAEIVNSWEMVSGPSVPPSYLTCVESLPAFSSMVDAIKLEMIQKKISLTCDQGVRLSSYSAGTITLGASAFENRVSMNRALFHEFLHRGSVLEDETVIAELEQCCAGNTPNPGQCSDLQTLRTNLESLIDEHRIQTSVVAIAMKDRAQRAQLIRLSSSAVTSANKLQAVRRFCASLKLSDERCLGMNTGNSSAEAGEQHHGNLTSITTAPSRVQPAKSGQAPTIPTRVTFTPGDVTSVAAMRPQVERFRSAAVTMTDHTQRSFAALKAGASNVAVASPRRTTSGSRTASRQASRSVPVEFESQIERVEANRTVLRTPMGLVAMTVPHSESTGLGEIRVERAELPNIPVPASQLVTRESNRSGNARGLAPARRDSSSDVSDQQGSTSSGSAAAGASSAGGSAQAQASAPSRGPRGPAGGGDFASRNTRWEDSLKGPSDIRRVLSDPAYSDRETLLRDTDFMARVSELKVQLIYQRRRYGPSDWQTRIDLDVQIPTESARPSR